MKEIKKNFLGCFIPNWFSYCFVDVILFVNVVILLLCESTKADMAVELGVIYCLHAYYRLHRI